jgi:hypothetical protein
VLPILPTVPMVFDEFSSTVLSITQRDELPNFGPKFGIVFSVGYDLQLARFDEHYCTDDLIESEGFT